MLRLSGMLSKLMQNQVYYGRGLAAKPPIAWQFLQFREKITILTSFGSHFQRFPSHWEEQN